MDSPRKLYWNPESTFNLSGKELEGLLKLGELFIAPKGSLSEDYKARVYMNFAETKDLIIKRFYEEGLFSETEPVRQEDISQEKL